MISFEALFPVARSTMRGIRTNKIGTAERNKSVFTILEETFILINIVLTPTDYGDIDYKFGCYSGEDDD